MLKSLFQLTPLIFALMGSANADARQGGLNADALEQRRSISHTPLIAFDNVAISVIDINRSVAWYTRVLGFKRGYAAHIDPLKADLVMIERGDIKIELLTRKTTQRNPDTAIVPGPHIDKTGAKALVFRTSDLTEMTAYLEQQSVQFEWKNKKLAADGLASTMIRDPDGLLINFLSYPTSRSPADAQSKSNPESGF